MKKIGAILSLLLASSTAFATISQETIFKSMQWTLSQSTAGISCETDSMTDCKNAYTVLQSVLFEIGKVDFKIHISKGDSKSLSSEGTLVLNYRESRDQMMIFVTRAKLNKKYGL